MIQPTAARVPNRDRKRRVAIVGSGITGLGAAYHLVTSCAEGGWVRSCFGGVFVGVGGVLGVCVYMYVCMVVDTYINIPHGHINLNYKRQPCCPETGEVEVVVYESNPTPGGHAHTEWVTDDKGQKVRACRDVCVER